MFDVCLPGGSWVTVSRVGAGWFECVSFGLPPVSIADAEIVWVDVAPRVSAEAWSWSVSKDSLVGLWIAAELADLEASFA